MENYNENEVGTEPVQQNNFEQTPMQEDSGFQAEDANGGGMFKVGSIIVILGILVLGGLYLWGAVADQDTNISDEQGLFDAELDSILPIVEEEGSAIDDALEGVVDTVADQLSTQSASDAIDDIEADLNASDLGDINLDDLGF